MFSLLSTITKKTISIKLLSLYAWGDIMKKIGLFPAVLLLMFGIYFLFQKTNAQIFDGLFSWQMSLIVIGLSFLISGHMERDHSTILPGTILIGLGVHLIYAPKVSTWPSHSTMFLCIIAVGLLLTSVSTKTGYIQSVIVFLFALFIHYYDDLMQSLNSKQQMVQMINTVEPLVVPLVQPAILILASGAIVLYMKKNKSS